MINHSPAQLIAELRRLMDMDYELLPGARHVLEEAIAVIRPLAEKSAIGEMIDPLRALLEELVIDANRLCDRNLGGTYEEDCRRTIAKARALLSAPVGSPPLLEFVAIARDLVRHVGCGDLDNQGQCLQCDAIRSLLGKLSDVQRNSFLRAAEIAESMAVGPWGDEHDAITPRHLVEQIVRAIKVSAPEEGRDPVKRPARVRVQGVVAAPPWVYALPAPASAMVADF
jgi:hypothetical protein